jgi:lauroyl/myristoyl acyltransferase
VVAGEGAADLTKLMEHYTRENEKAEQERVERVKEGKITTVYDDTTGGRIPNWVPWFGGSKKVLPGFKD